MAEAEAQEQPQAQPQPELASAVTEEPAHVLPPLPPLLPPSQEPPQPRLSQSGLKSSSQHPPPTVQPQEEELKEARTRASPPPEVDTNVSQQQQRIRETPNPQPPLSDAAPDSEIATTKAPEKESAPGKGPEDQHHRLQQDHASDVPLPTSSSPPVTPSSVPVTATTTVATENTKVSTAQTASTDPNTPSQDQQNEKSEQKDKDGAVSPSRDTMSHNPLHGPGTPRQASHYQAPSGYTAGGMSNAHYGYQNPAPQAHDLYRPNPLAPPNNAMPLPSMRTFDPVQQQSQQQQHMAMAMPVSPVPSVSSQPPLSYYAQQVAIGGMAGHPYANLPSDTMSQRYALPPGGPGAALTGSRHKKEIKRRTKTGCLTCRKRRIKCDELHPTCKNCQKSKRECLGYDPIFKNQQQSPQQSQPAQLSQPQRPQSHQHQQLHQQSHHAAGHNAQSAHSSATPVPSSASSIPHSGPSTSTPLTPGTTTSYTTGPPGISTGVAHSVSAYNSPGPGSLINSFSTTKNESHSYHPLDSSLHSNLTTSSMSTSHFPAATPITPHLIDYRAKEPPHLRGGGSCSVPLHANFSHTPLSPHMERTSAYSGISAHKMKVQELLAIGNAVPPALNAPMSQEKLVEVQDLYEQVYAPGLEKFFETEWYLKPGGSNALASNPRVQEVLAVFLQSLATTNPDDVSGMAYSANLEFRVVWELATLVYSSPEYKSSVSGGLPAADDASEARNRVVVFDTLLSGGFLDQNPLRPPIDNPDNANYHRNRELRFWYGLAQFLMIYDQPNMDMTPQRDHILAQLRELLDGRENRDVLYSLTVIRALSYKFPADFEITLPPHLDESDPKSKLAVARKFVQDEARVTGGTTNVVRRFAELGVRAFITPGYNLNLTR
ncbi:hypothetical protein GGS20DRAFT_187511 [Poronia punctata]|nr:hypothetical protein GGS20DRAFT_187511 [Poronia punctata]